MKDIFICHAGKDKEAIINPLIKALEENGISYWLDSEEIFWGDSISERINDGLKNSKYFIVVFSEAFISRNWPKMELASQINNEATSGTKKILPLFACNAETEGQILDDLQLIRDKMHLKWEDGTENIVKQLQRLLNGKTEADSRGVVRTIPMPELTKRITQFDKDKFIERTYNEIKSYFNEGLQQLSQNANIQTDLKEQTNQMFVCKIYIDGELKSSCKIWIAESYRNTIGYYAGNASGFSKSEAFNEMLTLKNNELSLRFTIGTMGMSNQNKYFTPEEAAEELWKRFTSNLQN